MHATRFFQRVAVQQHVYFVVYRFYADSRVLCRVKCMESVRTADSEYTFSRLKQHNDSHFIYRMEREREKKRIWDFDVVFILRGVCSGANRNAYFA